MENSKTKLDSCDTNKKNDEGDDEEEFNFDQMREKIYAEVANLISQNETRPFYLIRLFKELQYLREKNARDQVLKSIFNIANRQTHKVMGDESGDSSEKTSGSKKRKVKININILESFF